MTRPLYSSASPDPRLADYLTDYPDDLFTEQLYESVALAQGYATAHALALLAELGLAEPLKEWRSPDELLHGRRFVGRFLRALIWLLETGVEAGALARRGEPGSGRYRLVETSAPAFGASQLPVLRATALRNDPSIAATLDLLDTAAAGYPKVATGRSRGEDVLLGMGQLDLWQRYFNNGHRLYAVNNRVSATAAARRLAERADSNALRLLEIGAGAGSGSEALLDALDRHGLIDRIGQFIVSEPNAFLRRRSERALRAEHPGVPLTFLSLDIDTPWADALPESEGFDLIFAVNVLHVAKDLHFALHQARGCLADDGWLVAGECLRPFPGQPIYPELMFQILDSYIEVQTDPTIRPNPGFLTPEDWSTALTEAGFGHSEIAPDQSAIRQIYRWFFVGALCARRSAVDMAG
jgi:SAM-dependent methyltransferase